MDQIGGAKTVAINTLEIQVKEKDKRIKELESTVQQLKKNALLSHRSDVKYHKDAEIQFNYTTPTNGNKKVIYLLITL